MKKYILCGITAMFMLGMGSCDLQRDPLGTYSDATEGETETGEKVTFRDQAAVAAYISGMYAKLRDRQEHWYVDKLLITETHADNAYYGQGDAQGVPFETNEIEGSNPILSRDWDRYLEDVAYANVLINKVDEVKSLSTSTREGYRAQGLVFRALVYLDMVRIWGNIPLITAVADDITADNIEEVYPAYFPTQSTAEEVYRQIEKDLLDAIPNLSDNAGDKTVFTKGVAYALLTKVYIEKPIQDYAAVVQYADLCASQGYDLNQNYSDIWACNYQDNSRPAGESNLAISIANLNTTESILEAQCNAAGSTNWASWMFGRDEGDWGSNGWTWPRWITPSRDLVNAFTVEGDNQRYAQAIVWRSAAWSNYYPSSNYAFMYKLRSKYNSFIYLRYADILLLKAEAKIMSGSDLGGAADIIDRIRERVGLSKLPAAVRGDKDALLDAYLKERRLELAFEGSRWFDLVRLGKVEEVMNAVYAKDEGRLTQVYPFSQNSYLLPLPQTAIDDNDNLIQNPGY